MFCPPCWTVGLASAFTLSLRVPRKQNRLEPRDLGESMFGGGKFILKKSVLNVRFEGGKVSGMFLPRAGSRRCIPPILSQAECAGFIFW